MTARDRLTVIAIAAAAAILLPPLRLDQRAAAALAKRRHRHEPGATESTAPSTQATPEHDGPGTLRCGYHIHRSNSALHGDNLVHVSDSETAFYLDADLFDQLDDDTFMALAAAGGKMEALSAPAGPPIPMDAEPGEQATAQAWEAYRKLHGRLQGEDGTPAVAFAFETEPSE